MGNMAFIDAAIERKLRNLHCGYIGKVLATDGITAKVQPLGKIKQSDGTAIARAVVDNVAIGCRYKFRPKTINYATENGMESMQVAIVEEIAAGDLVVCLCADWNITAARKGKNEVPPAGAHSISDSIIVSIL